MVNRFVAHAGLCILKPLMALSFCRVLRDDPSKSDMHNREGLSVKAIWIALMDWHMWPLYVLGLVHFSMSPMFLPKKCILT